MPRCGRFTAHLTRGTPFVGKIATRALSKFMQLLLLLPAPLTSEFAALVEATNVEISRHHDQPYRKSSLEVGTMVLFISPETIEERAEQPHSCEQHPGNVEQCPSRWFQLPPELRSEILRLACAHQDTFKPATFSQLVEARRQERREYLKMGCHSGVRTPGLGGQCEC